MTLESPIEAGRNALRERQPRSNCPFDLNAPSKSERAKALAWVRAWSDANPLPMWADEADLDTDAPILGQGSASWRRARMIEEYVQKKYGDIQVSASCEPEHRLASALVIGRGGRLVFLEKTGSGGWGYTDDPDIARAGQDAWDNTAATTILAIAEAVQLLTKSL